MKPKKILALDGIRGIAILLVLFSHSLETWLGKARVFGFLGVNLFFVLSGFLITRILLMEREQTGDIDFGRFYVRRALRLLPALFALVGAWFAWNRLIHPVEKWDFWEPLGVLFYVFNWLLIFKSRESPFLGHCWSLSIEEQFYLLWPPLLRWNLRQGRSVRVLFWSCVVSILTVIGWRQWLFHLHAPRERVFLGTDTRADALLGGAALAIAQWQFGRVPPLEGVRGRWLLLSGIGVLLFTARWINSAHFSMATHFIYELSALSSILMIVGASASTSNYGVGLLERAELRWLGRISYGLYLWHFPVLHLVHSRLPSVPSLQVAVSIGLSLLTATVSYLFIEAPFLRLKRKFY